MAKMEADMFAKLNLTADQKKKIKGFQAARDAKMKKLMTTAPKGGDPRALFSQFRPISQDYRKSVESVLKPDQKKKYDDLRKEMRAKMGGGRGGPGGPGGRPGGPGRGPGGL
ncbi:hypothetical protein OP10G_4662 [Fimbriimonas ginsengisoli Gsoil 348]|uniref:Uncharacterized protein n=2 Tax=Fimbriimonas ginsengisoli TaxID=1005039 RepID=A0A068NYD3_FIMGI|nr:hypothetical protein OP10G_4662 [Fimbriimonas ginsengisoli Gsoil 348]